MCCYVIKINHHMQSPKKCHVSEQFAANMQQTTLDNLTNKIENYFKEDKFKCCAKL